MKKLILLLVLCPGFLVVAANDYLEKAEKAYDSKKYKVAVENYEALLKEGYQSYELYYNLANAYYRDNQLGRAIYNYELARKMEPNDEDVRINLSKAGAKTTDKIDAKENFFISAVKTNILSTFSTKWWAWFSIIGLFLASAFFFLFIHASVRTVKRTAFLLSAGFVCVFAATYFLGYSALHAKSKNKFAIILNRESKIYNEPTRAATAKFTLHEGTKIRLVENTGEWVLVKLDNGNEGWIKKAEIGII